MRLGLVTSEFPPDLGGVETYAYQLAAELGSRPEYQVTVYAPPASTVVDAPPGVLIKPWLTSCRKRDWERLRTESIDLWHALSAPHAWLALTGQPTVVSVHGNDFLAPYALTARPALRLPLLHRLKPYIWKQFDPYWRSATQRLIARALPQAAAIIANSHYTAEVFLQRYPACAATLRVAQVGVDARFFDIVRPPPGPIKKLLTVSRLSEPRKNIDLTIRALHALRERFNFEYTVAGAGNQRPELERLVAELGLSSRIRFVGKVTIDQLRVLYSQADLFVLTSSIIPGSHEGFGIVYLEAAAAGVPSLAARLAGAVEAISEGASGFFVEQPTVGELSTALARFLSGDLAFNAETCRAFAQHFRWPRIADLITAAYPTITPR